MTSTAGAETTKTSPAVCTTTCQHNFPGKCKRSAVQSGPFHARAAPHNSASTISTAQGLNHLFIRVQNLSTATHDNQHSLIITTTTTQTMYQLLQMHVHSYLATAQQLHVLSHQPTLCTAALLQTPQHTCQ
jgi:hypothetical protein